MEEEEEQRGVRGDRSSLEVEKMPEPRASGWEMPERGRGSGASSCLCSAASAARGAGARRWASPRCGARLSHYAPARARSTPQAWGHRAEGGGRVSALGKPREVQHRAGMGQEENDFVPPLECQLSLCPVPPCPQRGTSPPAQHGSTGRSEPGWDGTPDGRSAGRVVGSLGQVPARCPGWWLRAVLRCSGLCKQLQELDRGRGRSQGCALLAQQIAAGMLPALPER